MTDYEVWRSAMLVAGCVRGYGRDSFDREVSLWAGYAYELVRSHRAWLSVRDEARSLVDAKFTRHLDIHHVAAVFKDRESYAMGDLLGMISCFND